jgi:hypothetical protein
MRFFVKAAVFGALVLAATASAQAQPRVPFGDPEFEADVQRNWSPQARKQYYIDRRAYYLQRREQIRARQYYNQQQPFYYEQGDGSRPGYRYGY